MSQFVDREFDVLVATTIVESGLDIPNANTLIVDRADVYGLPALHQLRGRVGPQPGARLRLLPVPAGEAADRDRARAAVHDRPAHRGRRGHAHRAQGPGDPRRGQPARRRAVRARRRRRLRPVREDDRRGGPRAARRRPGRARRGPDRAAGGRAHPARLRDRRAAPAGGLHPDRGDRLRRPTSRRPEELTDRYGTAPAQVESLLAVARLRFIARRPGCPTSPSRAITSGSRRWSCPTPSRSGCSGCTRGRCSSRQCVPCSYRCPRRRPARAPGRAARAREPGRPFRWAPRRCATPSCSPGARN